MDQLVLVVVLRDLWGQPVFKAYKVYKAFKDLEQPVLKDFKDLLVQPVLKVPKVFRDYKVFKGSKDL